MESFCYVANLYRDGLSMKQFVVSLLFGAAFASPVMAADLNGNLTPALAPAPPPEPFINELRLGGFLHDLDSPEKNKGEDLNAELLFIKPWGTPDQWWLPRPELGTTINFEGGTSTVYAGAAWQYNITDWAFVEATFGGSLNNGKHSDFYSDRNGMGCNWAFRESASLGFNLTDHWRLMGTIEHNSNAGLCSNNRGLTNYGLRVGYKF
jgi:lipid A 3-O-deacylase